MIQRRVFVTGKVQGVGFRASTSVEVSKHAGLRGFVRNLADGRVEAVFCGEPEAVLKMTAWCRQGPGTARVERLEVIEEAVDPSLPAFSEPRP